MICVRQAYSSSNFAAALKYSGSPAEEEAPQTDEDDTLEDAVQAERDYVRERLREELKREPTAAEVDEWLRQHTEGY